MDIHSPPKFSSAKVHKPSGAGGQSASAEKEPAHRKAKKALHAPAWMVYAVLCIFWWGVWGFLSKLGSDRVQPHQLQFLFTFGLVPPVVLAWVQLGGKLETDLRGSLYGILNGAFSGLGMLAFYTALAKGKASLIGPFTALFPLLTIVLAFIFLHERINRVQAAGMILALIAILILSM